MTENVFFPSRYIIDKDFPGMRISPEPTTDHFHVVDFGEEDGRIPGNVLAFDNKKPFTQLQQFGGKFLQKFECSTTKSDVLKSLCMVDTPGKMVMNKAEATMRKHLRHPGRGETVSQQRLRLCCCAEVVRRESGQDHPPV